MTIGPLRNNLGDWQNPPVIQDQVIAYMEQIDAPMLLREIYRPLHLPKVAVNRVLGRLHAKGFLTRYQIPIETPGRVRAGRPSTAIRRCYLYRFAELSSS